MYYQSINKQWKNKQNERPLRALPKTTSPKALLRINFPLKNKQPRMFVRIIILYIIYIWIIFMWIRMHAGIRGEPLGLDVCKSRILPYPNRGFSPIKRFSAENWTDSGGSDELFMGQVRQVVPRCRPSSARPISLSSPSSTSPQPILMIRCPYSPVGSLW